MKVLSSALVETSAAADPDEGSDGGSIDVVTVLDTF
jgi:hypothetical protein